jgi:hypothetical protein
VIPEVLSNVIRKQDQEGRKNRVICGADVLWTTGAPLSPPLEDGAGETLQHFVTKGPAYLWLRLVPRY